MSQIDKAFLSAYAKKRPIQPASNPALNPALNEVQPLHDPTGERILRIHLPSAESWQPHGSAVPTQSHPQPGSLVTPEPTPQPPTASIPTTTTVSEGPKGNSVHVSQSTTRIASSSSIRRESSSSVAPQAVAPQAAASNAAPPQNPAKSVASSAEPPPRKTLTSYLQQARQSAAQPVLPTRWSTAKPPAQTAPAHAPTSHAQPAAKPLPTSVKQLRIDAPHSSNPPVERPTSTVPWSFGTVERSIKATADSKSITARTNNEASHFASPLSTTDLNLSSDVVMKFDRAAKAGELKPNFHSHAETPASRPSSPAPSAATPPATQPAATQPAATQPAAAQPAAAQSIETQRRTPPVGKSLNADSLAKISLPIQPVWEVDDFLWPNAVANLLVTQSEAFHEIGLHLQHAQSKGLRVLSITSGERGVGRSTVSMCLAKTLSKLGMKIGLLDGDYECPSLVDQLNLEAQCGWQQCLFENVPLDEVAIHSVDEAITLFPLTDSIAVSQVAAHTSRINKLIKRISNAYDMVIIDANRVTQKQSHLLGAGDEAVLDATLLIVDAELSLRQRVDAAVDLVRQQGVQSIGLVENFHS